MEVVCVTHNWRREGAQLVLAQVARLLRSSGWAVVAASPTDEPGPLQEELAGHGVLVETCSLATLRAHAAAGRRLLVNTAMLWELAEALGPRVAWVVHESGLQTLFAQMPAFEAAAREGLLQRTRCVFVCDTQAAEYAELTGGTAARIYNGIDLAALDALRVRRDETRAELGLSADACLLVTVGTPKPRKGQAGVLRAARALGLPVAVVGCGGSDAAYEEELRGLADAQVHLIARGGPDLVTKYLTAADVYVCNSELESFPLGILEALGCELPVVSADCGGIREQLDASCGVLLPPSPCDSPERHAALVAALTPLAADAVRRARMGAAGRRRVEALFTEAAMREAYDALLRNL